MNNIIELLQNHISAFDLIIFLIIIYSMAQCAAKGFMLSLLSFSKWLLALIITIILVPKFNPYVQEYVESKLGKVNWIREPFDSRVELQWNKLKPMTLKIDEPATKTFAPASIN